MLSLENYEEFYKAAALPEQREFIRKHADVLPLDFVIKEGGVRYLAQLPPGYRKVKAVIRPTFDKQIMTFDSDCSLEYQLGAMSTWDGCHIGPGECIVGACSLLLSSEQWCFPKSSLWEMGVSYSIAYCAELAQRRDAWLKYVIEQNPTHALSTPDTGQTFLRFNPIDMKQYSACRTTIDFVCEENVIYFDGDSVHLACNHDSEVRLTLLLQQIKP